MITGHIISDLCLKLHPEASTELEALDLEASEYYKIIQDKLRLNLDAREDLEIYYAITKTRVERLQQHFQKYINKVAS